MGALDWESPRTARQGRVLAGAGLLLGVLAVLALQAREDGTAAPAFPVEQSVRAVADPLDELPKHYARRPPIGAWTPLPEGPLAPRMAHTAVWTGEEMLVWGGVGTRGRRLVDGAAYDPFARMWRSIPPPALPAGVDRPVPAVWTGTGRAPERPEHGELVLWSATRDGEVGLAYGPGRDRWRELPPAPVAPRVGHALVWSGAEVIVWGGVHPRTGAVHGDGAAYDPLTGRWRVLPEAPLAGRRDPAVAAGGGLVLLWGGRRSDASDWSLTDGAAYRSGDDRWVQLPALPAHVVLGAAAAPPRLAWADGGAVLDFMLTDANGERVVAVLDRAAWRWSVAPRPLELRQHPAIVPAGSGTVLLWGGTPRPGRPVADGAVFHLATGGWRTLRAGPPPLAGQSAVWSGRQLLVWGGADAAGRPTGAGAAFDPAGKTRTISRGR